VSNAFGELFVQCPSKADSESKVQVTVEYLHRDGTKGAVADLRALTVATARYVAQDLLDYEGAETLDAGWVLGSREARARIRRRIAEWRGGRS
jgi:hypothetical protein